MATAVRTANGTWDDENWTGGSGSGGAPASTDDVDLHGYAVTVDSVAQCATLSDNLGGGVLTVTTAGELTCSALIDSVTQSCQLVVTGGTVSIGDVTHASVVTMISMSGGEVTISGDVTLSDNATVLVEQTGGTLTADVGLAATASGWTVFQIGGGTADITIALPLNGVLSGTLATCDSTAQLTLATDTSVLSLASSLSVLQMYGGSATVRGTITSSMSCFTIGFSSGNLVIDADAETIAGSSYPLIETSGSGTITLTGNVIANDGLAAGVIAANTTVDIIVTGPINIGPVSCLVYNEAGATITLASSAITLSAFGYLVLGNYGNVTLDIPVNATFTLVGDVAGEHKYGGARTTMMFAPSGLL